jgi:glycolate oxidase
MTADTGTWRSRASGREIAAALASVLPASRVITDPDVMRGQSQDQGQWSPAGQPAALVRPRQAAEVQAAVATCARLNVPVVARGAGSGVTGGANAIDGCVVLSLQQMNRIVEIEPLERLAVVQPGVINADLQAAAAEEGLWYPPDPASAAWSTIGGNVATNAGGLCCARYGVTRDYVLGLEVVIGTGDLVRLGRRTAKGVAGYDLTGLLVGSEGTLGVITEITVRLRPQPPPATAVVGYFGSGAAAGQAVRAIAAAGLSPAVLELIDHRCLKAVDAWTGMGLASEAEVLLLGQIHDAEENGAADRIVEAFEAAGATWAARSTDPLEAEELFEARKLSYPALERLGSVLVEDVCVPVANLPQMLADVHAAADRYEVLIGTIGHAGDGNLHPLIVVDPADPDARGRAEQAFDEILQRALDLGGTISGEHGIGLLKRDALTRELSPPVLALHRAIKTALDPCEIFNPGKVFTT